MAVFATPASAGTGQADAWAVGYGGTGSDEGRGVAVDASGNVYTTGEFEGTVDFDPGTDTENHTSAGGSDVFVSKFDADGSHQWTRRFGSTGNDAGIAIAVDESGNVYTTGNFEGTVDFDPGAGTKNLTTSTALGDVFVSKLDGNGDFGWAGAFSGALFDTGLAIAVDGSHNVYTTGYFRDTVDFNPGGGVDSLTSSGDREVFVSKLDVDGDYVWARRLGGSDDEWGFGIGVDGSGNVLTVGYFEGTADFDPGGGTQNLVSAGGTDVFVSKLDSGGNHVWAKRIGGSSTDLAFGGAVDGTGNVYLTGRFSGTVDFDPDASTFNLTAAAAPDGYVAKLDGSGSLVWARRFGSTGTVSGNSVAVDGSHNVYTTGDFQLIVDLDPGAPAWNFTSEGGTDAFVSKLDSGGDFEWGIAFGSSDADIGKAIATTSTGTVVVAGAYTNAVDFDPGPGTLNLTSAGGSDAFLMRPATLKSSVELSKSPDAQGVPSGGAAAFTVTVTNTGGTDLRQVSVADPATPDCALTAAQVRALNNQKGNPVGFRFKPGETFTYTCDATNVTAGFTNTATATGSLGTNQVTDSDNADVTID